MNTDRAKQFFKTPAHQARFVQAMRQSGKIEEGLLDREYAAALYILTADAATYRKAQGYISSDGIQIKTLFAEVDFSSGYATLIKLAGNLFNRDMHLDPVELMDIDEINFKVAMCAMMIRRDPPLLIELTKAGNE